MDATLVIMFAAVLVMTTALSFMELRRIRKALEGKELVVREKTTVAQATQ
ncbi:MAG TPA: hypothetical protein VFB28_06720 [Terriglobales bacterium]|nr:hypothetical protein [Terriglobales bacterium]